jgi:outer membrane immunogenic protein
MKKILLTFSALAVGTTAAAAADLAVKAPPPPQPVCIWCGFYIGGNAGWAWGGDSNELSPEGFLLGPPPHAFPLSIDSRSGFTGGGQLGYNWQLGAAVLGIEGDINFLDFRSKSASVVVPFALGFGSGTFPNTQTFNLGSENFFSTVRGRLGYAWDRSLFYVTGGVAFGDGQINNVTFVNTTPGVNFATFQNPGGVSNVGWTAGAGFEYAVDYNWSVKFEYLFVDLNNRNRTLVPIAVAGAPAPINAFFSDTGGDRFNVVRVGVNYKFGGPPVVARY